ncbi:hypothetical protein J6590_049859, partial [Homalodisca vitripennis]
VGYSVSPEVKTSGCGGLWSPSEMGTKEMRPANSQTQAMDATATLRVTHRLYLQ